MAGRAGSGKSTLLQNLTGLSPEEIPSGDKGHCTGAPSIVVNHESPETYANIQFHSEQSFMDDVILPFYEKLKLEAQPSNLDEFANSKLTRESGSNDQSSTDDEHVKRLAMYQQSLPAFRKHLTGGNQRVAKNEIRSFIAQSEQNGTELHSWRAVRMAKVYCHFPQGDIGAIAVGDTPGLGDFLSGAEERLISTIGRNLDAVVLLRKVKVPRPVIFPEDAALYDLVKRSIPELPVKDWSYFLANDDTNKSPKTDQEKNAETEVIDFFRRELQGSTIKTRESYFVDCRDKNEVSVCLDAMLDNISKNLGALDEKLFVRHLDSMRSLSANIRAFAGMASHALPATSAVAPDQHRFVKLFNSLWVNLSSQLEEIVQEYKSIRNDRDIQFLETLNQVFATLRDGPNLPSEDEIRRESAQMGLAAWHAEQIHKLRVEIASSFEAVDRCLDASFDELRNRLLEPMKSNSGGKLEVPLSAFGGESWEGIKDLWKGHADETLIVHAIDLLLSSGLSFRGFIQPRVRTALDVLDSGSEEAQDFAHVPGDSIKIVVEKLQLAWTKALSDCKHTMSEIAVEPSMARFAAAEDFVDTIIRADGPHAAKERWNLFYRELRSEIWRNEFAILEAETKLRKDWEAQVATLTTAAAQLAQLKLQ